jgi:hypothetical protein
MLTETSFVLKSANDAIFVRFGKRVEHVLVVYKGALGCFVWILFVRRRWTSSSPFPLRPIGLRTLVGWAVPAELPAPILVLDSPYPEPLAEFFGALALRRVAVVRLIGIGFHDFLRAS